MVFWVLAFLVLAVFLGGGYYAYRYAFFSPKMGRETLPACEGRQYAPYQAEIRRIFRELQERPCEFVTVPSADGLILSGRYYHVADGAPLDIGFHGYRSACLTDFAGGAELSEKMGHNLLLVDQRAHGKSTGRTISFGILERWDVLSWVNYAVERFGSNVQILLYGISMGAATVLMASDLPLPENVKGIIADCPYSSPKEIICKVARDRGLPVKAAWCFVWIGARVYGGFDPNEADAVRAVKHTKVPILLIHGEADGFVPCAMSADIQRSNPRRIRRFTFPGADHGISFLRDEARYEAIVTEFCGKFIT